MVGRDADRAELLAAIADPLLRDRLAAAWDGGRPLSERELFEVAAAVADPEVRRGIVARACGDDERKCRAVQALLDADREETAALLAPLLGAEPAPVIWPAAPDPALDASAALHRCPDRIGRYRIQKLLGTGSFGAVWLGYDDELDRPVAVKVPHRGRIDGSAAAESFLAEARFAAALSHANIVPVHDVGRLDDGSVYVVSRFIAGPPLRAVLGEGRIGYEDAARLIATVARALHHAHQRGVIHRDVTPRNILVEESSGTPFVTDFGVAVAQARSLADTRIAGTPSYMSPEQAKGEAHRLDGRSDVFSLGSILYELLTGRQAFYGTTTMEILEAVATAHPPPPHDYDPTVPAELDRICGKALAKRLGDRYASAAALADDLEAWLAGGEADAVVELPIEPKGLRSFDAVDAGAFLQLLPGSRGRDGLPESLRFWKSRLDETDPDKTFAMGLLYGPSGCGKSSLVKAGIVPRLGPHVRPIVLDASSDDTEARLLRMLRKAVGSVVEGAGLVEAFAAVRESGGPKLVLILDQFEQWLQARPDASREPLVAALRQCDGRRLQCLVLVRDDFAMSAARFMEALEVPIEEGHNFATVDLFTVDHARAVLVRFGQGLGRLPRRTENMSADEIAFVATAIAGLGGTEQRVVPVQLALFVDLVRTRPWTPATLQALGASAGAGHLLDRVGVAFLEDSFNARSATPSHKLHAAAAKRVLEALLPETGAAIRGHKRSSADLRALSGYESRPGDFTTLLRILDGELRLVTPTEPPAEKSTSGGAGSGAAHYQLTHDYLVPALRDWITGDRRRTAKGRAELVLADRTAIWSERKESQQLPSLLEWLGIRWHTRSAGWRPAERRMMRRADRVHGTRAAIVAALAVLLGAGGMVAKRGVVARQIALEAAGAVDTLLAADIGAIDAAVAALPRHAALVVPVLRDVVARDESDGRKLRAALGLAALSGAGTGEADRESVRYLTERLLVAEPTEVKAIVTALTPQAAAVAERMKREAVAPAGGPRRLRAAAVLAAHRPDDPDWPRIASAVAEDLVNVPAVYLAVWLDAFRGVRRTLVPVLVPIFADPRRRETERSIAADILCTYAADDPVTLADLSMTTEPSQVATLAGPVGGLLDAVAPRLEAAIAMTLPADLPSAAPEREALAIRQAKGAAMLLRFGRGDRVWPLFVHSPDPRVRSHMIHLVGPFGVDPTLLVERLGVETDVSAKRALVLALGDIVAAATSDDVLTRRLHEALVPELRTIFTADPDPGLHSAAEWTLHQLGERKWIRKRVQEWREGRVDPSPASRAEWNRSPSITIGLGEVSPLGPPSKPRWTVNSQGQVLVVVPGPGEITVGSPPSEEHRQSDEQQKAVRIAASFAIGATPVTRGQYRRVMGAPEEMLPYLAKHLLGIDASEREGDDVPQVGITWFEAARYCNDLARMEGLPENQLVYMQSGLGGPVTGIHPDHASRTGYRLPTEAEWEYSVRSGAVTSRPHGQSAALISSYAVCNGETDQAWPVACRKPNDLGLFDGLGNVWNWTQDAYMEQGIGGAAFGPLAGDHLRSKRGGDYSLRSTKMRVAFRNFDRAAGAAVNVGFRVARTLAMLPDGENRPTARHPALDREAETR